MPSKYPTKEGRGHQIIMRDKALLKTKGVTTEGSMT